MKHIYRYAVICCFLFTIACTESKTTPPLVIKTYAVCIDKHYPSVVRVNACEQVLNSKHKEGFDLALVHEHMGIALFGQKKYDTAIKHFDASIKIRSTDADVQYNRALALEKTGRLNDAVAAYHEVIALNPDHYRALNNRGNLYTKAKKLRYALRDYTNALRVKPDHYNSIVNRASLYMTLREYNRAIIDYEAAIKLRPKDADAHYGQALSWWAHGRLTIALGSLEKTLELDPKNKRAQRSKKQVLQELRKLAIKHKLIKPDKNGEPVVTPKNKKSSPTIKK